MGKGIGSLLGNSVIPYAKKHDFNQLLVEPDHPATRHIYVNKLGFRNIQEINLQKWVDPDGGKPWEACSDDTFICTTRCDQNH